MLNYTGKEKPVSLGEPLRTCWGTLSILITEEILAEAMAKGNYVSFSSDFAEQLAKQNPEALSRQRVQGRCRPCWGWFCTSAGKISLGLKEANLNIACVQKL